MKKAKAYAFGVAVIMIAALELIRPSIPAPADTAEMVAPMSATRVLRTSCYSCHSNERRLSWFDQIVPGYWLVRHDILSARRHLNFSTLGTKPAAAQRAALFEAVNMAELGAMPLKSFAMLHPEARVNREDLVRLEAFLAPWADTPAQTSMPAEFHLPDTVAPNASGLNFDRNYTAWHLLSVTDRGDNDTFRFILGNNIALQAAREGKVSPWPDGAKFAKIAWQQRSTPDGEIEPGDFVQIEMMAKDGSTYRSSDGWGWGRWKGPAFKPYGENSTVVEECTGCHAPMRHNDFVYTMPIAHASNDRDAFNSRAAILPKLPFNPFTANPVTMYVDRGQQLISVLFLRSKAGKELLLVHWKEQEDPHWFGARIPGEFVSAEYVSTQLNASAPAYLRILPDGSIDNTVDSNSARARTHFIEQLEVAPSLSR